MFCKWQRWISVSIEGEEEKMRTGLLRNEITFYSACTRLTSPFRNSQGNLHVFVQEIKYRS